MTHPERVPPLPDDLPRSAGLGASSSAAGSRRDDVAHLPSLAEIALALLAPAERLMLLPK